MFWIFEQFEPRIHSGPWEDWLAAIAMACNLAISICALAVMVCLFLLYESRKKQMKKIISVKILAFLFFMIAVARIFVVVQFYWTPARLIVVIDFLFLVLIAILAVQLPTAIAAWGALPSLQDYWDSVEALHRERERRMKLLSLVRKMGPLLGLKEWSEEAKSKLSAIRKELEACKELEGESESVKLS